MFILLSFSLLLLIINVIDCELFFEKRDIIFGVKVICNVLLIILFLFLINGNNILINAHIKAYEKGDIVKEYTIINNDTTYRFIYKRN